MKRFMVDIETIGSGVSAPIIQIGACRFTLEGLSGTDSLFEVNIDATDAIAHGAKAEGNTFYWWLEQSEEARKAVSAQPRVTEAAALFQLNEFLRGADEIWSHATFDFVLIVEAMKRRGITPAFSYRACRDIRTLASLSKADVSGIQREGVHHTGLADAIFQARYVAAMLTSLK